MRKQIEDKERVKDLHKQIQLVERDAFGRVVSQNKLVEQSVTGEKKAKQALYRELLDTQVQYAKEL